MKISRLEIMVESIALESQEITKDELYKRLGSMGLDSELMEELKDSLWDMYNILRERNRSC